MKAMEVLLSRRWILKERDKELYYEIRDHIGLMRKFLTEKLGYQMIVNPYLVKIEKIPLLRKTGWEFPHLMIRRNMYFFVWY